MSPERARSLLSVSEPASPEQIQQAFRQRARAAHPDRGGDPERFREFTEARRVLLVGSSEQETSSERPGRATRGRTIVVSESRVDRTARRVGRLVSRASDRARSATGRPPRPGRRVR